MRPECSASSAIPKIESAVKSYAYATWGSYRVWPGPNSNTFTATLLRAAPELAVAMPSEAVGRDFRERCEHKIALQHPRMRNLQLRKLDGQVIVQKNVHIEQTRPFCKFFFAAELRFDFAKRVQQIHRRE